MTDPSLPLDSSPETPRGRNVMKTLLAAGWMYGGRGMGLLWTLAVIAKLGIDDYGLYAMGFALATICAAPLDNPFSVRAIRESDELFLSERTTRLIMGFGIMLLGVALMPVSYIVWFGLIAGGGEVVFNTFKSQNLRDGHPDRVMRIDTVRQGSSIGLATAYLFVFPHPTLYVATLIYVAPYFVVAALTAFQVRGHRPTLPGPPRLVAALAAEHLGNAAYIQGDILLLGFLADSTVAGYFSVATTFAWAVAAIGQSFAVTYHESLRSSEGHVSAGPPIRNVITVSALAGLVVLLVGVVLLLTPAPTPLGLSMVVMSLFTAIRSTNYVFTAVLYMQKKDSIRAGAAVAMAPVKLGLVAALIGLGAVGAAIASVVTDLLLLLLYITVIYSKRFSKDPTELGKDEV